METKNITWVGKLVKAVTFLMVIAVIALAGASIAFGASIYGYVRNDTAFIAGVNVSVYSGSTLLNLTTTNAGGYYNATFDGTGGVFANMTFVEAGHQYAEQFPVVIPNNTTQKLVNLSMIPVGGFPSAGNIIGTVQNNESTNLAGALVTANSSAGTYSGFTDALGNFNITVQAETYDITYSAANHNSTTETGVVVAGLATVNRGTITLNVVTSDTTAPGQVSSLTGSETSTAGTIRWTWDNPTDPDLAYLNISVDGTTVFTGIANSWQQSGYASCGATGTISIVSVDTSGNPSAAITYAVSTGSCASTPPTGGGSSSSNYYNTPVMPSLDYVVLDFAEANSYTKTLERNDIVKFVHDRKTYYISTISISQSTVNFKLMPNQMYLTLQSGETKNLSVDGDHELDYTMTLDKINYGDQKIVVTLSKITDEEPEPEPVIDKIENTVEVIAQTLTKKPSLQKGIVVSAAIAAICFLLYLLFFVWV